MTNQSAQWLLGLGALLAAVLLIVLTYRWEGSYYVKPWATETARRQEIKRLQQAQEEGSADEPASQEPKAPGFQEKEIRKQQGKRFQTY